ncbi:MAG: hypothetical protein ABIJ05_01680 [Patescibacteria group bacterium]
MNIEKGNIGSRIIKTPKDDYFVLDPNGRSVCIRGADFYRLKTDRGIRKMVERKNLLKKKENLALLALSPIILELAGGSSEWPDLGSLDGNLWKKVNKNNPFFIESNPNETFKKATNYLLQIKGNNVENIADSLLSASKVRNFADRRVGFEMAKQELVELIKSKNPERFSRK